MIKTIKKVVLVAIMMSSIFNFGGCMSRDQKAEKEILAALNEKYKEEFEMEAIGGGWGTMNNNTLKARCYPKGDTSMKFNVEITKDTKKVYDSYLNVAVARNSEKPIEDLARSVWSDCKVDIYNDTGMTYPEHSNTKMTFQEFYKLYPQNWMLIHVYIKSPETVDKDAEVDKFEKLAGLLTANKYIKSMVSVVYLKPDAYARYDQLRSTEYDILGTYTESRLENMHLIFGSDINSDGQVEESREDLLKYFEKWDKPV